MAKKTTVPKKKAPVTKTVVTEKESGQPKLPKRLWAMSKPKNHLSRIMCILMVINFIMYVSFKVFKDYLDISLDDLYFLTGTFTLSVVSLVESYRAAETMKRILHVIFGFFCVISIYFIILWCLGKNSGIFYYWWAIGCSSVGFIYVLSNKK